MPPLPGLEERKSQISISNVIFHFFCGIRATYNQDST
jgi:hypothetical protein